MVPLKNMNHCAGLVITKIDPLRIASTLGEIHSLLSGSEVVDLRIISSIENNPYRATPNGETLFFVCDKNASIDQLKEAYALGSRYFVVSKQFGIPELIDAEFIVVDNCTSALFKVVSYFLNEKNQSSFQKKKHFIHQTNIHINLKTIASNIATIQQGLRKETKTLVMLKALGYGTDATKLASFIELLDVDYIGVAYPNEGVELRESGVTLPILVMNSDTRSYPTCLEYSLEPTLFDFEDLKELIHYLKSTNTSSFPVHLKIETGMHRLGFSENEIEKLINTVKQENALCVRSIYSHLAESGKLNSPFTENQIQLFDQLSTQITSSLAYPVTPHILNSNGTINYPQGQFDMVRIGIGLYGSTLHAELLPAIQWTTIVSQVKKIKTGESVGYGRTYIAEKDSIIAILPVGYADGISRLLGNQVGQVYIHGKAFNIIGTVCMDMTMIEVDSSVQKGDAVEIIGPHQTIEAFASMMNTISYEVMTSFSQRNQRVYVTD